MKNKLHLFLLIFLSIATLIFNGGYNFYKAQIIFIIYFMTLILIGYHHFRFDGSIIKVLVVVLAVNFLYLVPLPNYILNYISLGIQNFKSIEDTGFNFLALSKRLSIHSIYFIASCIVLYGLLKHIVDANKSESVIFIITIVTVFSAVIDFIEVHIVADNFIIFRNLPWGENSIVALRGFNDYKNHFAYQLNVVILLNIYLLMNKSAFRILILFVFLPSLLFFLFLTDSRLGYLGLIVSVSILFVFAIHNKKRKTITILSLLIFVVCIIVMIQHERGVSPNGRIAMLKTFVEISLDFPIFGAGPRGYEVIQNVYKAPELNVTPMSKKLHNDYLEVLTNYGIFSLLFAGLYARYLIIYVRSKRIGLKACKEFMPLFLACLIFAFSMLLDFMINNIINIFYLFVTFLILDKHLPNKIGDDK